MGGGFLHKHTTAYLHAVYLIHSRMQTDQRYVGASGISETVPIYECCAAVLFDMQREGRASTI